MSATTFDVDPDDFDGKVVAFLNFGAGTAIDLSGGESNPPNGTPCIGFHAHLMENQQWKLIRLKRDSRGVPLFRIQNMKATGRAMDLYNGNPADDTKITGWQTGSTTNEHQLWYIRPVGKFQDHGTVVKIENYGTSTFVDLYYGDSTDGTRIVGWSGSIDSLNTHQLWILKFM